MNTIEVEQGIIFNPPALFFTKSKTLILADLHLGAEETLQNKGFFIPKTQTKKLLERIEKLLSTHKPKKIILAGDIKHSFGTILNDEWRDVRTLLQLTKKHKVKTIIVKGNHDQILAPILKTESIEMKNSIIIENFLIIHGDKKENEKEFEQAQGLIIGHEHPSLLLDDGVRKEQYKCLLKGNYKDKTLYILPSTYPLVEGTNILENTGLGPIRKKASELEAYLIEDYKAYAFGKIDSLGNNRQKV